MKKILFLILLLAAFGHKPIQAQTANPSHVGVCLTTSCNQAGTPVFNPSFSSRGSCTTGGFSCTITLSVTAGQFVVVAPASQNFSSNTMTVGDTNNDTFNQAPGSPYLDAGIALGALFEATMGTTNASEVVTCTYTSVTNYNLCAANVYSGTLTGWDVTAAGANNASATCPYTVTTGTTSTTANAHELGVALMFSTNNSATATWTGLSGWTNRTPATQAGGGNIALLDNILSSTQTLTATATFAGCSAATPSLGLVSSIK